MIVVYFRSTLQESIQILINLVTNYSISQQLLWITIQGNIKLNLGSQTHRIIKHLETMCWIKAHNSHSLPKWKLLFMHTSVSPSLTTHQYSSVAQSCLTLCDPMNHSMPGFHVHHQILEFTPTHVHRVSDAIHPSHPLSSPSPPALNLSQYQGLFKWVSSSYQVAKVLEFQLQHQSFQWIFRTDFL